MSTVMVPDPLPTPREDSENLMKAFKGWGTNERAVINILGRRIASQRLAIAEEYQRLYNETLMQSLRSEISGDFGKAVFLWVTDPPERDAKLVNKSFMKKGDRHVWPIIEVACATSPHHLVAVRKAYCALYNMSMEEDIASHFAQQQPLRQFLVSLVTSYRFAGVNVDQDVATLEASQLYDALMKKDLYHEDVRRILSTRNKAQLKATLILYKRNFGSDFDEDIKNLNSKDSYVSLLKSVVWCLCYPEKHFAEVIRTSIVGLGTDEDSLSRAIVTRAEIDTQKIKEEYERAYKNTLESDVREDTSGDYEAFLLTLIGSDKV